MRRLLLPLLLGLLPSLAGAQQAVSPHGSLAVPCAACHGPEGWKPVRVTGAFRHAPGTFPLEGAHARTTCTGCHKRLDFRGASPKCAGCHEDVHKGELGAECSRCHTARSFAEEPSMKQAHELTRFPLRGAHAAADCSACHPPSSSGRLQFVGRSTTCQSCHAADARAVAVPDHQAAGFVRECTACHSINSWKNARFDHAQTAFPLTGAHQVATCEGCHADRVYRGKPTSCVSCHRADYDAAATPRHADGFPTSCADCHSDGQWKGARFDHNATRFPLSGAHVAARCSGCHADGLFRGQVTDCVSCHRARYEATAAPPHGPAGFGTACTSCHNTSAWLGAPFDHGTTRFALSGAHRAVSCAGCHSDNVYRGKGTTCASCHLPEYRAATAPRHDGFPTTCESCHQSLAWRPSTFSHDQSAFPLTGAHRAASCEGCHGDGVYDGKATECVACHRARYDATTRPAHAAAGYSTTCATCHNTTAWLGTPFNHATTRFPLTGAHGAASCQSCHADGVYRGKPMDCFSCHRDDYDGTTTPPHAAAGYGTSCSTCHTTAAWLGATFNHSATQFPLTGAHAATPCQACHGNGVYRGKPTACLSCHQAAYAGTTRPPHGSSGIGTACTACHTTTTWTGGAYDHNVTAFPLTGAHRATPCSGCHADGVYRGKPSTCVGCHQAEYASTTRPPHGSSGIGTACATCHTTAAWPGGTYDHAVTAFPLTGAHASTPCAICHGDGVYRGKGTACVSCHESDYARTTNPNHAAAMFPATCASCHTTATWLGATFDHDAQYFRIYSGKHRGKWSTCTTCHTSPTSFKAFTCLTCHEHNQTKMDDTHKSRAGYRYESVLCYACHPRA